jgi:site-specific recombinase XerD
LLGACDRRRAIGRRDFAVIVLMLRLGLRATEVATLRLEDLDWRAGQLTVHGKGGRVDELPLPVDVGEAIAAYLRRGRPREAAVRQVFLRVAPPQAAMTRSGVTAIVAGAARRAGLGVVRPHRLRHTAASDMLRSGAPLAEIGQVLRHRSAGSTAIYARVDVERLRTIAQPWPSGAAS